ncbi:MAG: response regulator [Candidatus Omnitrophica bacterium]|nr:response regulator [Candidatus Omnitrophota bacterium]MBU1996600.1 response regulator [Candidatus Omnitrophota bacterium]MBU4334219.1 response regulator [Candidatus Omnitrophota bacterium]
MNKKSFVIEIIGYGLALAYSIILASILELSKVPELRIRANIVIVMFAVLFIGYIAVVLLKERGRVLIVIVNVMVVLYLIQPHMEKKWILSLVYVVIYAILFLIFNQIKNKQFFSKKKTKKWKSILIIDDDQTQVMTVRPMLMSAGYSVLSAETGEMGLQIAETQKPDLILLDVILPGMKGREVCKRLKNNEVTKDIPVIFVTVKDSKDEIVAEMDAGAHAHLTKPISVKVLISTIRSILG